MVEQLDSRRSGAVERPRHFRTTSEISKRLQIWSGSQRRSPASGDPTPASASKAPEFGAGKEYIPYRAHECYREALLGIGFRTSFENGSEFLEEYCEKLEDDMRQEHENEVIARLRPSRMT
jgi:hypothetical protein